MIVNLDLEIDSTKSKAMFVQEYEALYSKKIGNRIFAFLATMDENTGAPLIFIGSFDLNLNLIFFKKF